MEMTEKSICMPNKSINLDKCHDGSHCIKLDALYPTSPEPIPVDTPKSTPIEVFRKLCAEFLGTGLLLNIIIGAGTMSGRLSPSDSGLQLLESAISVGCGLMGLIIIFGPVSGAHFNPCVTIVDFLHGDMSLNSTAFYIVSQMSGGILGALLASAQFDEKLALSFISRDSEHLWLGEVIATMTLLLLIHGCIRTGQKSSVPSAVGAWVITGHFFTSSTIFANPAVTVGRMFTKTNAGIDPSSAGLFICCQFVGMLIGFVLIKFFYPKAVEMKSDDNLYLRICVQQAQQKNISN